MGESFIDRAAATQERNRQRVAEAQEKYRQQQAAAQARSLAKAKSRQEVTTPTTTPPTHAASDGKTAQRDFATVYQVPADCEHWQSDAHMVECVNHRVRAKAAFLAQGINDNRGLQ